jgi:uncharacterized membrane protein (DUF2068 family)
MSAGFHLNTRPKQQDTAHLKGLRTVASLEFIKGVLALIAVAGVLSLLHRDTWDVVESILGFLHINPERHLAQVLLDRADRITDKNLWQVAALAFAYATLRFVEAYGLWRARPWAEWLAFGSGCLYLPFEILELARRPSLIHAAILAINLIIVVYMLYLRTWGRASVVSGAGAYQEGD